MKPRWTVAGGEGGGEEGGENGAKRCEEWEEVENINESCWRDSNNRIGKRSEENDVNKTLADKGMDGKEKKR